MPPRAPRPRSTSCKPHFTALQQHPLPAGVTSPPAFAPAAFPTLCNLATPHHRQPSLPPISSPSTCSLFLPQHRPLQPSHRPRHHPLASPTSSLHRQQTLIPTQPPATHEIPTNNPAPLSDPTPVEPASMRSTTSPPPCAQPTTPPHPPLATPPQASTSNRQHLRPSPSATLHPHDRLPLCLAQHPRLLRLNPRPLAASPNTNGHRHPLPASDHSQQSTPPPRHRLELLRRTLAARPTAPSHQRLPSTSDARRDSAAELLNCSNLTATSNTPTLPLHPRRPRTSPATHASTRRRARLRSVLMHTSDRRLPAAS